MAIGSLEPAMAETRNRLANAIAIPILIPILILIPIPIRFRFRFWFLFRLRFQISISISICNWQFAISISVCRLLWLPDNYSADYFRWQQQERQRDDFLNFPRVRAGREWARPAAWPAKIQNSKHNSHAQEWKKKKNSSRKATLASPATSALSLTGQLATGGRHQLSWT